MHQILLLLAALTLASLAPVAGAECRPFAAEAGPVPKDGLRLRAAAETILGPIKSRIRYADIPSATALHLPSAAPAKAGKPPLLSPGLCDPYLEEARARNSFEDFKPLSDARPRALDKAARATLLEKARAAEKDGGRRAFLKTYIEGAYEFSDETEGAPDLAPPAFRIRTGHPTWDAAFAATETVLPSLVRRASADSPAVRGGSLLAPPYPFLIAAPGRFREGYYWDTYFGLLGVLATGRLDLAQMQAENFLESVRRYGRVPNGTRDYYLSRSQPPFLSRIVRAVYEATPPSAKRKRWLRKRAYPLVARDYRRFWMDPTRRWGRVTGLNHDWDALDLPRPERHGLDDEKKLGESYRDVRAAAETGLDFTVAFDRRATRVAGVMLNALLYGTERDLEWAARELGRKSDAREFAAAAERRRKAIDKYLWDPARGEYDNYDLERHRRIPVLGAATFVPLYVGLASPEQAKAALKRLPALERPGGMMASEKTDSTHQWDGVNGWAPFQVMTAAGLRRYGFTADAKRLATAWVETVAAVHARTGLLFERYDVAKRDYPGADGTKYPTQVGFLWTNSSLVWMLTDVLGFKPEPTKSPGSGR